MDSAPQSYQLHCLSIDVEENNLHLIKFMAEDIGMFVQSLQSPVRSLEYAGEKPFFVCDGSLLQHGSSLILVMKASALKTQLIKIVIVRIRE